jgi:hypothetical protein
MRRSGVVLLITLAFITAIIGIIGLQYKIINGGMQRLNKENMITQSNLIYANIQEEFIPNFIKQFVAPILDTTKGDANRTMVIHTFLSIFENGIPLNSFGLDFPNFDVLNIKISAASTKFNINNFKNVTGEDERAVFEQYFIENQIEDSTLFFNILDRVLETNKTRQDWEYLTADENYIFNSPFFKRGEIYDMDQFQQLLQFYVDESNDTKIFSLPWRDLVQFQSSDVEFCKMSPELRFMLFPDFHEQWMQEEEQRLNDAQNDTMLIPTSDCNQEDYNQTDNKDIQKRFDDFGITFSAHTKLDCELYIANDTVEYEYHFQIDLAGDKVNSTQLSRALEIKL